MVEEKVEKVEANDYDYIMRDPRIRQLVEILRGIHEYQLKKSERKVKTDPKSI